MKLRQSEMQYLRQMQQLVKSYMPDLLTAMQQETLNIHGRHDPCIVPRAVPCVEAAAAIAILDSMLEFYGTEYFYGIE